MQLQSLRDLYLEHIRDLYSAEQQIVEALPKMIERCSNPKLRDGFTHHLEQTREHVRRLETIGDRLGEKISGTTCKGMEGLLKEGDEVIKGGGDPNVLDAALISAAQRVEHYEMAGYGCARSYASALGFDEDAGTLQETLDEEGETDQKLTHLALSIINPGAQKSIGVERETPISSQRDERIRSTERPSPDARA